MGRRGDEDQVPPWVSCHAAQEEMALVTAAALQPPEGAGVCLINDYQLGAGEQKLVAPPVRLDEVGRDDHEWIHLEERLPNAQRAFETSSRTGEHQLGIQVELRPQLRL